MRRATMVAYAGGGRSAVGGVQNLRREVYEPARRCSVGGISTGMTHFSQRS
jgi:hypothetical protein